MAKKSVTVDDHGKMKRKPYEKQLDKLQAELCHLQEWVKHKGLRVIVVFEGRDAAGKGGTIKAITARVSPRVFRVVALPAPTERREVADIHPTLHGALPGRRRGRHLRPQLVQPGRRGARDGVLHGQGPSPLSRVVSRLRETHRRRRHRADQVLAGGERQGAEGPVRSADQGPGAPVEAQPDGPAVAQPLVRVPHVPAT